MSLLVGPQLMCSLGVQGLANCLPLNVCWNRSHMTMGVTVRFSTVGVVFGFLQGCACRYPTSHPLPPTSLSLPHLPPHSLPPPTSHPTAHPPHSPPPTPLSPPNLSQLPPLHLCGSAHLRGFVVLVWRRRRERAGWWEVGEVGLPPPTFHHPGCWWWLEGQTGAGGVGGGAGGGGGRLEWEVGRRWEEGRVGGK